MELPPDFAEEAKTISDFRRTLEAQRLGSMDPMDAKSAVARWHSDVQSLTSKLAAQLTYSRALSKHEEVTSLMTEPPEQRERRELQQWIAQTKTDTRFLHDLVCESVHHPASQQARRAQVQTALEASRAGSSAAATAAIMNVAVEPLDAATIASRELERRLRSLVFEDEDELLAVVKDPRGTAAAARAGRRSGDRSNIDPSVRRAMTSAADLRMRAHGKFRKGYLVPGTGGGSGGGAAESAAGGGAGAGAGAGAGGGGGGAGDRRVAFSEVQELLKLRDESVGALAAHVLRRHAELQASLGLSGWTTGRPGASGGGAMGGGAGGGGGGAYGGGGGGGGGGPGGSVASGTPRLRRLREGASSFATSLADVLSVFDSVDAVLRRVRLTEEGRSTATTIAAMQHELAEAKASLAEKEVERLRLSERLAALKQSRSGGVTTQAMEIDTQLLEAQQTRAQLVVREREAEALARQSNETAERNAALQREITLLRTRLGTAKEALRPRVVEVESRTREALSTVQELRQSLDLLAGMYQRACDQLAASKRSVEDLTEERGRLAKAVQAEVKRARVLAGEVARMDAVNVRLMAAHDSLRAAYRGAKAAGGAGRSKGGREAAQRAASEAGTEAMRRLAGGIKSIAREAMERLRLVQGAGGDGSLLSAEALRRIVDVCHTASSTGEALTQEPAEGSTWGASR